eukprot:GHVU01132483.1.p1 GENE.GHVU01132483.1~~GHVU01132483.1.p1  ORF type:complete len:162 (-),score=28.34 GHVU01132483.1:935-1420(-)
MHYCLKTLYLFFASLALQQSDSPVAFAVGMLVTLASIFTLVFSFVVFINRTNTIKARQVKDPKEGIRFDSQSSPIVILAVLTLAILISLGLSIKGWYDPRAAPVHMRRKPQWVHHPIGGNWGPTGASTSQRGRGGGGGGAVGGANVSSTTGYYGYGYGYYY